MDIFARFLWDFFIKIGVGIMLLALGVLIRVLWRRFRRPSWPEDLSTVGLEVGWWGRCVVVLFIVAAVVTLAFFILQDPLQR